MVGYPDGPVEPVRDGGLGGVGQQPGDFVLVLVGHELVQHERRVGGQEVSAARSPRPFIRIEYPFDPVDVPFGESHVLEGDQFGHARDPHPPEGLLGDGDPADQRLEGLRPLAAESTSIPADQPIGIGCGLLHGPVQPGPVGDGHASPPEGLDVGVDRLAVEPDGPFDTPAIQGDIPGLVGDPQEKHVRHDVVAEELHRVVLRVDEDVFFRPCVPFDQRFHGGHVRAGHLGIVYHLRGGDAGSAHYGRGPVRGGDLQVERIHRARDVRREVEVATPRRDVARRRRLPVPQHDGGFHGTALLRQSRAVHLAHLLPVEKRGDGKQVCHGHDAGAADPDEMYRVFAIQGCFTGRLYQVGPFEHGAFRFDRLAVPDRFDGDE